MKNSMVKRGFILFIVLILTTATFFGVIVLLNQASADSNDNLVINRTKSDYENVISVKNIQNYIDAERLKGHSDKEIGINICSALGYDNEEISKLSDNEILNYMSDRAITKQEMLFEVTEKGEFKKSSIAKTSASEWENEGIDYDVENRGWLNCTLQVEQNMKYDLNRTTYDKKAKIYIAEKYGYVLTCNWNWIKLPMNKRDDAFSVSWDDSIVEPAPEFYGDYREVQKQANNLSLNDLQEYIKNLDSYCYVSGTHFDDVTGINYYGGNPFDKGAFINKGLKMPFDIQNTLNIHYYAKIILRGKHYEDFMIDSQYGHKQLLFSGSVGFSGKSIGLSIDKSIGLDIFDVNVRHAHIAPLEGWTYA